MIETRSVYREYTIAGESRSCDGEAQRQRKWSTECLGTRPGQEVAFLDPFDRLHQSEDQGYFTHDYLARAFDFRRWYQSERIDS